MTAIILHQLFKLYHTLYPQKATHLLDFESGSYRNLCNPQSKLRILGRALHNSPDELCKQLALCFVLFCYILVVVDLAIYMYCCLDNRVITDHAVIKMD